MSCLQGRSGVSVNWDVRFLCTGMCCFSIKISVCGIIFPAYLEVLEVSEVIGGSCSRVEMEYFSLSAIYLWLSLAVKCSHNFLQWFHFKLVMKELKCSAKLLFLAQHHCDFQPQPACFLSNPLCTCQPLIWEHVPCTSSTPGLFLCPLWGLK